MDFALRLAHRIQPGTCLDLPNLDRFVGAAADQDITIGRKCQIKNRTVVPREGPQRGRRVNIPKDDFRIVAGGGDDLLIR